MISKIKQFILKLLKKGEPDEHEKTLGNRSMIELTDSLKARIRAHEGVRTSMYLDSLGKATIGIGHLIQPHEREKFSEGVEISMELVEELFDFRLE